MSAVYAIVGISIQYLAWYYFLQNTPPVSFFSNQSLAFFLRSLAIQAFICATLGGVHGQATAWRRQRASPSRNNPWQFALSNFPREVRVTKRGGDELEGRISLPVDGDSTRDIVLSNPVIIHRDEDGEIINERELDGYEYIPADRIDHIGFPEEPDPEAFGGANVSQTFSAEPVRAVGRDLISAQAQIRRLVADTSKDLYARGENLYKRASNQPAPTFLNVFLFFLPPLIFLFVNQSGHLQTRLLLQGNPEFDISIWTNVLFGSISGSEAGYILLLFYSPLVIFSFDEFDGLLRYSGIRWGMLLTLSPPVAVLTRIVAEIGYNPAVSEATFNGETVYLWFVVVLGSSMGWLYIKHLSKNLSYPDLVMAVCLTTYLLLVIASFSAGGPIQLLPAIVILLGTLSFAQGVTPKDWNLWNPFELLSNIYKCREELLPYLISLVLFVVIIRNVADANVSLEHYTSSMYLASILGFIVALLTELCIYWMEDAGIFANISLSSNG